MSRELRQYLRKQLPEYMVPSAFVMLDELPLTPNGKVDRRPLPLPPGERPEVAASYIAPRTETARLIVSIWQEVLGLKRIGIKREFF